MKPETEKIIAAVFALGVALAAGVSLRAYDTWVALRDSTRCGHVVLAKNSDRAHFDCQPLMFHPRKRWPAGSEIDLGRVRIPQVQQTYANMGSSPYWCWGYEEGINEYGVAIGNEGIRTKVLVEDVAASKAGKGPALGPTGMDLLRLGLERGKTAREALEAITTLLEKYGQFGSGVPTRNLDGAYHNSYIIADPKEAWVLETAGRDWVAKRFSKGTTSISNIVSLGSDYDLASSTLVEHAVGKGWWPADRTGEFHFRDAYSLGGKSSFANGDLRGERSLSLLKERGRDIDIRWMMRIARDRATSPGIDMGGTASSCVAVLPEAEDQLPVFWWCPSRPGASCYVPFFIHGSGLPAIVSTAGSYGRRIEGPSRTKKDGFSSRSYWWLFRDLCDRVEADPQHRARIVRDTFDALEMEFAAGIPGVMEKAVEARKAGENGKAAGVLDRYTETCLDKAFEKMKQLRTRFEAARKMPGKPKTDLSGETGLILQSRFERPDRTTIAGQPVDKPKTTSENETNAIIRLGAEGRKSAQAAANWPQFRGPLGDGHCEAKGLPLEWSETRNVQWKTSIHDQGWSSPVIWDDQVWMTTATADGKRLYAVCVDRDTGKIVHDIPVFDVQQPQEIWGNKNGHASPTPVIEAGDVYVHFGTYGTACLDTRTGQTLWARRDLNCFHRVGPASSPIIYGNLLIFHVDGCDVRYVVALDKATGKTVWKTDRSADCQEAPYGFRYACCTPTVTQFAGRRQMISPGPRAVIAYDPLTGEELWKVNNLGWAVVPRPVCGHGVAFVTTDQNHPQLQAVRLDGRGDVTDSHVVWGIAKGVPSIPSLLLVGDLLYLVSDPGIMSCVDAKSGAIAWKERLPGNYRASPIYADGRIYVTNVNGVTTVIEPGRRFNVLAVNELGDGTRLEASFAVAERALFVRTETHLYRIED